MPVRFASPASSARDDDAQVQPDSRRVVPATASRATRTGAHAPTPGARPGQPSIAVAEALLDERRELTAEHARLNRE
jgi:hypothetical protein